MEQDKINAYMTLYTCLVTLAKCAAPMIPFMTEDIYQNLVRSIDKTAPESVHLCDFPVANEAWINKELEDDMEDVMDVVVIGRACRNAANIKNRQPIGNMFIKAPWTLGEFYIDIVKEELNVKNVEFKDDVRAFTSYTFKPQLKTLGPKYGKILNDIRKALSEIDGNEAMEQINSSGSLKLNINGTDIELEKADLLIDMAQTEGYASDSNNGVTVVLDTNLTPELVEEGFVREIISKIQQMRKEAGFEVMDKITIYYKADEKVSGIFTQYGDTIRKDVLALDIAADQNGEFASDAAGVYNKEWNINGEQVLLGVKKGGN